MLISESLMSKFKCYHVHVKAHSPYHIVHLGSRKGPYELRWAECTQVLCGTVCVRHMNVHGHGARNCACSIVRDQWIGM